MIQATKKKKKNQQKTQIGHFVLPKTDFSIPMFWLANLRPQQRRVSEEESDSKDQKRLFEFIIYVFLTLVFGCAARYMTTTSA